MLQYSVEDISGAWTVFAIHYLDPTSGSWVLLDPDAPGEMWWNPQGTSGWGWIEYQSFPY